MSEREGGRPFPCYRIKGDRIYFFEGEPAWDNQPRFWLEGPMELAKQVAVAGQVVLFVLENGWDAAIERRPTMEGR